jgi:xanthine dehydrogenase accessory factor
VLATVVAARGSTPRQPGARMLVLADGNIVGTVGGGQREGEVIAAARELLVESGSRLLAIDFAEGLAGGGPAPICGGGMEVFLERIDPPRRVVVAGAGHVGQAVHGVLRVLGIATVVVDPRPEQNSEARFPGADRRVVPFDGGLAGLDLSSADGVVIVTPGHSHDEAVLRQALATPAGYVGMMGSRTKVPIILEHLRADGFPPEQLARVHAPIGLDIGAETPAEIAVAIAAEIVALSRR